MTIKYSNPRTSAIIENWPSGSKRVAAHFSIECHPTRGERAVRVTTGAPKKLTFARKMRIVDGDDGRTYIAELTSYGFINIRRSDMQYGEETVHIDNPRHAELLALFANECRTCDGTGFDTKNGDDKNICLDCNGSGEV